MDGLTIKEKFLLSIIFLFILYNLFPVFPDYTHIPESYLCLIVVSVIITLYPECLKKAPVKWLLVYLFLLAFYALCGRSIFIDGMSSDLPAWWRILIEAAWMAPAVLIMLVVQMINKKCLYKYISMGTIIILVASFIYILPMLLSVTNILRGGDESDYTAENKPFGLPGYALMHSYALMPMPLILMMKKKSTWKRLLYVSILLLFVYVIFQTSVTTSLFILLATILFYITYSKSSQTRTFVYTSLAIILLYILYHYGFFLWLVDSLMPLYENSVVLYKLQDLHDSMVQGTIQGGSLTGRLDYHAISQNSFWIDPILGGGIAGGHSKIWDILGCMGIVMFLPFFMVIVTCFKQTIEKVSDKETKAYVLFSYFLSFIFLYEKGIFGTSGWLFMLVLIPSIIVSIINDANNKL